MTIPEYIYSTLVIVVSGFIGIGLLIALAIVLSFVGNWLWEKAERFINR
jgi:UPF0716 family protein affecting phage T7 exclusion